jgi:hypothetical protein
MWGRKNKPIEPKDEEVAPPPLREAMRQARIEAAERTGIVVDLRDAEVARLELLNEALDPVFAEVPSEIDLFDRGISRGDPPRLWIDAVSHVLMGRDKRSYRFVQDNRYGRKIIAESTEVPEITAEVTKYVARRIVDRERALAADDRPPKNKLNAGHSRWHDVRVFLSGVFIGVAALITAAWVLIIYMR